MRRLPLPRSLQQLGRSTADWTGDHGAARGQSIGRDRIVPAVLSARSVTVVDVRKSSDHRVQRDRISTTIEAGILAGSRALRLEQRRQGLRPDWPGQPEAGLGSTKPCTKERFVVDVAGLTRTRIDEADRC